MDGLDPSGVRRFLRHHSSNTVGTHTYNIYFYFFFFFFFCPLTNSANNCDLDIRLPEREIRKHAHQHVPHERSAQRKESDELRTTQGCTGKTKTNNRTNMGKVGSKNTCPVTFFYGLQDISKIEFMYTLTKIIAIQFRSYGNLK